MNFVACGQKVWGMSGIPIGGSQSRVGLALAMFYLEQFTFSEPDLFLKLCILRYVDDVLLISGLLCASCLGKWMQNTYGSLFAQCDSPGNFLGSKVWLDLDIGTCNGNVIFGLHLATSKNVTVNKMLYF